VQQEPTVSQTVGQDGNEPGAPAARRWRAGLRSFVDAQPFTLLFWVVLASALLGLKYLAGPRMDLVVMVMGYVGIALCGLSLLMVAPAALVLWRLMRRRKDAAPSAVEAGVPIRTGFSIPNLWWMPLLSVEWEWLSPRGARVRAISRGLRKHEEVTFTKRGRVGAVVRSFTVSDALGLAKVSWRHKTVEVMTILPSTGQLRQMPVIQAFQSGDEIPHPAGQPEGGRYEIRKYVHGISARHIVWKVFGRTRRLMVREPERAIARSSNSAAYLIAAPDDEAAAGAARVAVETGVLGMKWLFGADGAPSNSVTIADALESIAVSGEHSDLAGTGLPSFMERAGARGFNRCIVFAPPTAGSWLNVVTTVAAEYPGQVEVVVGTDGLTMIPAMSWWKRAFLAPKEIEVTEKVEALEDVVVRLRKLGVNPTVVDRPSGRPIGASARQLLMARADRSMIRMPGVAR
jgi:hypothetical protein